VQLVLQYRFKAIAIDGKTGTFGVMDYSGITHQGVSYMYVVIFRATIKQLDEQYSQMASRMRELALTEYGCLEFTALTEGEQEIALSYWPDEQSIRSWREHPEHKQAQLLGQQHWYTSYSVQVAQISRHYHGDQRPLVQKTETKP
jgi:heme-degrading monooxygenase HmoA